MSTDETTDRTLRIVLIVIAALVIVPMLMMVLAFPLMGMWGGGVMGYGMTGGTGLWGLGMSLIWLVVLVGLGYLGYRWLSGSAVAGGDRAMEELRLAYARGELTDEQFEERRAKLSRE